MDEEQLATLETLQRMADQGEDLSTPRDIEFSVFFAQQSKASAFLHLIEKRELIGAIYEHEDGAWDVIVTCKILPAEPEITSMERLLDELAYPLSGHTDGWGCFQAE
jgi:hypothetical protein